MVQSPMIEPQMISCRCKTVKKKKRTIIAGLNSETCGREMLLGLLTSVVKPEDNVIAIHVEETDDTFDPNTFHVHEDLCKSKKIDFEVKVCIAESYISELTYQVRVSYATILTLGLQLFRAQCFSHQCLPERVTSFMHTSEAEGSSRHFASQELRYATNNFSSEMVIGEGGHSKVYRATLEDGRAAAVKVLKTTHHSVRDLFREVDFLSSMNHKNIVQIIGFCDSGEMLAIVYDLLQGSLRKNLRQLNWSERMKVAIGVAKALDLPSFILKPSHQFIGMSSLLTSSSPMIANQYCPILEQQCTSSISACRCAI
ncbi:hypothetical protein M0R45_009866 [Rubus argutus]|uniref:Protein kinase domain-containing protein n=1 Tax=Rubus argutus TaxID=59490 RepID=A0AAW1Y8S4_RUBAR